MPLNNSGPISLGGSTSGQSIALELGLSPTGTISLNTSAVRTLAEKPSGSITMPTDFWGKPINTGLFAGGVQSPSTRIQSIAISTTGNSTSFGNLTLGRQLLGAVGSSTRAVWAGGTDGSTPYSTIDYNTFSSAGNSINFGNLNAISFALAVGNCGSSTRGIFSGGRDLETGFQSTIRFITIASEGNSSNFGSLLNSCSGLGSCSSQTRGVMANGRAASEHLNVIQYITIASTGSAIDFGDTSARTDGLSGCSSSTRGVFALSKEFDVSNVMEYVTIASTGNAIDFGDLLFAVRSTAACSSTTRGIFAGGRTSFAGGDINVISYITIASTGNAIDFGDLIANVSGFAGTSNCHGGL